MNKNIIQLINQANKILVITHIYPDIDAICSGIVTFDFLSQIKDISQITFNIEGDIDSKYKDFAGFKNIKNNKTKEIINDLKPDLIILVDTNTIKNVSSSDEVNIREFIKEQNIKTIVIDNHPEGQKDYSDAYINNHLSSSVEEVFNFFTRDLNLIPSTTVSELTMCGILADTNRFLYKLENFNDTLENVKTLMKNGVRVEPVWNSIYHFNKPEFRAISILLNNFTEDTACNYNYSYISDIEIEKLKLEGVTWEDISNGYYMFVDLFIRYTGKAKWGFAILPEFEGNNYRVSLRAIDDLVDTSAIARAFGGGGHKSASGCSLKAENYQDAINKIIEKIDF